MKLEKNFNKIEFDSKCGREMPKSVLKNIQELAKNLQVLRNYTGKVVTINSGYRSPEHNKMVGGVSNSQHVKGNASDIRIKSITPLQLYKIIERLIKSGKMKEGGLGLYKTFVHYDIRGTKARWDYSN